MLLTAGGCGIWTIIDLVRSSTMAAEYNNGVEMQAISRILERRRAATTMPAGDQQAPPSSF
jgi:hypothetical protein